MKIKKAVFPVAGFGTRFLPATKAMPKEMLPVVDKPLVQYAVEEAFEAGIEEIIFVTGKNKVAVTNHFDFAYEVEQALCSNNNIEMVDTINSIVPKSGTIAYTVQNQPLGLGHAIWCARNLVNDQPFAVLLADDLIKAKTPVLSQMIKQFEELNSSIVAVMEVDKNETDKYGIIEPENSSSDILKLNNIIEKPEVDKAPSNLAVIGRYILTPEIFDILGKQKKGAKGEIQLTDAIAELINIQNVFGYKFEGIRYDCGDKTGFQIANISYALENPSIQKDKLLSFLKEVLKNN